MSPAGRPWPPREQGSATVEFVTIGVLLLVPLVYLVIALGRVQAASFAADASAREAARAFVTAPDEGTGRARADAALALGLRDQGFDDPADRALTLTCARTPCLTPGAEVSVEVTVRVVLPGVPGFVDRAVPTAVTVRAQQVVVVDEFRSTGGAG